MNTLNGIELPQGLFWHDRYNYTPINQVNMVSITGRVVILRSQLQDGRVITLTGNESSNMLKKSELDVLSSLRGNPNPFNLVYDGVTYLVRFDLASENHFDVSPVWGDTLSTSQESMWSINSITLIEVLA